MRSLLFLAALALCTAAAAQGTILAVYVNGTGLDTINPATGATISSVTLTPSVGGLIGCTGIAQDPTTGILYLAVRNTATQTDMSLATVNRTTGAVTKLGGFVSTGAESVSGIQFNTAGQLYAVTGETLSGTPNPTTLFTVNKATGAMTLFQALGNGDNGETIGFDPTNTAVMFHWSGTATQVYETVNLTTGADTPVVHSGVPASATILCMAWDSNNQWFWTCTNLSQFGYIRPNGTYVQGFGAMAGQVKGMVVLPTIDPAVTSLNLGTTTAGTASTPVNFNLAGFNLFGNVNIASPAGVEVSLSSGSGYTNSLNVPRSSVSGQLNTTQVFARITTAAPQGPITAVNLTLTATGADTATISLSGQVDPPPTPPEMDVRDSGNISVPDGGADAIGSLPITTTQTVSYSILNLGDLDLVLVGAPLVAVTAGANVQNLSVTMLPTTPVAGATQTSFEVSFQIVAAVAFDFDISIDNNDSDEDPYNFTVSGTGMAPPPVFPEMDVLRAAAPIADGGTDTLPTQQIGNINVVYTINNTGAADLTITTPATISGETNCTVTATAQPANTVVAAGTTTLELTIVPTAAGAFSFQISIVNNDANENPYDISVAGNVTAPPPPPDDDDGGDEDEDEGGCSTGGNPAPVWIALAGLALAIIGMRRLRSSECGACAHARSTNPSGSIGEAAASPSFFGCVMLHVKSRHTVIGTPWGSALVEETDHAKSVVRDNHDPRAGVIAALTFTRRRRARA